MQLTFPTLTITIKYGFSFVKTSTNIIPIISCSADEKGAFSPYTALDSGRSSNLLVVNQREGQPPALDANGKEEFYIGNVNYGSEMLTCHYPDVGRPKVQTWWGDQYKVGKPHSHRPIRFEKWLSFFLSRNFNQGNHSRLS